MGMARVKGSIRQKTPRGSQRRPRRKKRNSLQGRWRPGALPGDQGAVRGSLIVRRNGLGGKQPAYINQFVDEGPGFDLTKGSCDLAQKVIVSSRAAVVRPLGFYVCGRTRLLGIQQRIRNRKGREHGELNCRENSDCHTANRGTVGSGNDHVARCLWGLVRTASSARPFGPVKKIVRGN